MKKEVLLYGSLDQLSRRFIQIARDETSYTQEDMALALMDVHLGNLR